jgi:hydroxypyruvate isomerase
VTRRLGANLSTLFADRPMADRFEAAARSGFDSVEIQFADEHPLEALQRARDAAGLPVTLVNVPRGGAEDVGLAALPGREAEFAAAVATCLRYAEGLGVEKVNVLAGRPPAGTAPDRAWETLTANLRHAADRFAGIGVRVMVEPLNPRDMAGFFLLGLDAGLEALERAAHPNLALQFDLYHMAITETDLPQAAARAGGAIGHVQFADAPGRHEPGTGSTDFAPALDALDAAGYRGVLSAEYHPRGRTEDGLGWMTAFRGD